MLTGPGDKPLRKARRVKPPSPPGALDVLPKAPGQAPKPYRLPVAKTVARKVAQNQRQVSSQIHDTKSNAELHAGQRYDRKLRATPLGKVSDAQHAGYSPADLREAAARGYIRTVHPGPLSGDAPQLLGHLLHITSAPAPQLTQGPNSDVYARRRKDLANAPGPVKFLIRGVNDYANVEANAIPSTIKLGSDIVHGRASKVAHSLVDPYVQVFKHPLKSFSQHPVQSSLLFYGAEGAIGHGAGKIARSLPSDAARKAGSVQRAAAVDAHTKLVEPRAYSRNLTHKQVQVALDKRNGLPAMTEKQVARRTVEDRSAAQHTAMRHEAQVVKQVRKAVGRKPKATVVTAAQGITSHRIPDIQAYIQQAEAHAKAAGLKGSDLAEHQKAIGDLHHALKSHDPQQVLAAVKAHNALSLAQEQQLIDRGMLSPQVAANARLTPVAVRRLGAVTGKVPKQVVSTLADQRVAAARVVRDASRTQDKVEIGMQKALADARVSVAKTKRSPQLKGAERARNDAVRKVAQLRREQQGHADRSVVHAARMQLARQAVRDAERQVIQARASIKGVAPREADQLRNALNARDQARATVKASRVDAAVARRRHIDVRKAIGQGAPVTATGQVLDQSTLRAALHGAPEPAYITHQTGGPRGQSALPVDAPKLARKMERTGEKVSTARINTDGRVLEQQVAARQNLIDAHDHYHAWLESNAYRDHPNADVSTFRTRTYAQDAAHNVSNDTGRAWVPKQDARTGDWVIVQKAAADTLAKLNNVKAPPLARFSARWRRNVLAFNPKWPTRNMMEAALRSLVGGVGPRSYVQGRRVLAELKANDPATYDQTMSRVVGSGGQAGMVQDTAREATAGAHALANWTRSLADTKTAQGLARSYGAYTQFIFHDFNGTMENQFRVAMFGKALRDHPLMERSTIKLSQQAVEDAARGLKDTTAQVQLARQVDRMYGQYDKFGPQMREAIVMYTPFAAWTVNAARFLGEVLPKDHPVLMSLLASASQATEQWRKDHGLVYDIASQVPGKTKDWLQGTYPLSGDRHLPVSSGTPFGLLDQEGGAVAGIAHLVLPQFTEPMLNAFGKDWKLTDLSKNPNQARNALAAAVSLIENQIPALNPALTLSGAKTPNMADNKHMKPVGARAKSFVNPLAPYSSSKKSGKVVVIQPRGGGKLRIAPLPAAPPPPPPSTYLPPPPPPPR